jgi:hypothetical protein
VGPRALTVTSKAGLVASVEQSEALTKFAFERGSRLRLRILKAPRAAPPEGRVEG